jgi:hypothetical protein
VSDRSAIDEIRRRYPNPVDSWHEDGYCVGGALCMAAGLDTDGFPPSEQIEAAVKQLGADPKQYDFEHLCYLITEFNDAGEFEEAWRVASAILDSGKERAILAPARA